MNSVIFEDIARIQAEKKQKRKEMLKLMNENPDWYRHPKSMVYRQIKMLGKDIGEQTMDKSKPISSIQHPLLLRMHWLENMRSFL